MWHWKWIPRDARDLQILWLGTFLTYGILFLGWHANLPLYLALLAGTLTIQTAGIFWKGLPWSSLKSAVITAIGMSIFLRTNMPLIGFVAGAMAIGSKFVLRWNDKHVFNPANFGLIGSMLLTSEVWISPGQWGNEVVAIFLIASCGMVVTLKVGRWDSGISFLATLFALEAARTVLYQGWPIDHLLHSFSNGTLFLFAFFMITDPMTSPNHRTARVLWAAALAAITFLLSNIVQLYTAPVWALFGWSLFTPIFDQLKSYRKYQWI